MFRFTHKAGARLDVKDNDGATPLMLAAINGRETCIDLLLKVGADVNIVNENGNSALSHAISTNSHHCVDLLLKYTNPLFLDEVLALATKRTCAKCVNKMRRCELYKQKMHYGSFMLCCSKWPL